MRVKIEKQRGTNTFKTSVEKRIEGQGRVKVRSLAVPIADVKGVIESAHAEVTQVFADRANPGRA